MNNVLTISVKRVIKNIKPISRKEAEIQQILSSHIC